jgi:hypothetical protein
MIGETGTAARAEVRNWLLRNGKGLTETTLTDTTPLLDGRHITSLQIPELLMLLESLRQCPLDLSALKAGDLRDVKTICGRFLGE